MTQQLAHHTINGCNLRPGDLLGTGTISGPVRVVNSNLWHHLQFPNLWQPSTEKTLYVRGGFFRAYLDRTMSSVVKANIDEPAVQDDESTDSPVKP